MLVSLRRNSHKKSERRRPRSDARFAQTYWPWILLSQKQPLPESYLLGAPKAVFLYKPFGQGSFVP